MIDLRSEIVIQPSAGMRQAMASAPAGADLFGEDPSVVNLERRTADLLGKEAAMFLPTLTMGNLIALKLLGRTGEEAIVESRSHIFGGEMGGISTVCGMLARPVDGDASGRLCWEKVRRAVRARSSTRAQTTVLCLENTHNFAGGSVMSLEATETICVSAREHGLKLHLDGARLFNAAIACGAPVGKLAEHFDSVAVSFSKGLGAPAGAVLACTAPMIEEARRLRRMLGGSMNQPGILAAACLHALDQNYDRLADDHRRAKEIANALARLSWAVLDPDSVQTNIVIFEPAENANGPLIVSRLKSAGLLSYPLDDGRVRLVTHLDFTDEKLDQALEIFRNLNAN